MILSQRALALPFCLITTLLACTENENEKTSVPASERGSPSGANDGEPLESSPPPVEGTSPPGDRSEGACEVTPAAVYADGSLATHATIELAVVQRFRALNQLLSNTEKKPTLALSQGDLTALLRAGDPSLKTLTTPEYATRLEVLFGAFVGAAGKTWAYGKAPSGSGGKLGNYLFSAEGTDLRQNVEKGMYGATLYRHALTLRAGGVDAALLDRLLVLYGAPPSFPGVSEGDATVKDSFAAQYAERRSPKAPNDTTQPADKAAPGPYFRIKSSFLHAQAALAAGTASCRMAATSDVDAILREWETTLAATVIYYLKDAAKKFSADGATDTDLANGLHSYGEAVAFVGGFRGLPADGRVLSDTTIDAVLNDLGAPVQGPVTSYELLTNPAAKLPKFLAAQKKLQKVYGFTTEALTSFETNY